MTSKTCGCCKEEKTKEDFHRRTLSPDGLAATCKECSAELVKEWNKNNPENRFESRRKSHLRRRFDISLEQYNQMLEEQNGCCAICERHRSEFNKEFAVDHNHKTGEIRGLLCTNCNYRLVARHTNGDLLRRIADYIEQGTGWFVPQKRRPVKRKPKRNG